MKKGTGPKIAKLAAKILDNPNSGVKAKELAGSALTQSRAPKERTSPKLARIASEVLLDNRFSKDAKKLAGSVLAQRKK
jgi:hypothetical protein